MLVATPILTLGHASGCDELNVSVGQAQSRALHLTEYRARSLHVRQVHCDPLSSVWGLRPREERKGKKINTPALSGSPLLSTSTLLTLFETLFPA